MKTQPMNDGANTIDKVQCPNCCRMAPVTERKMGLLFFECELCGTTGAVPERTDPA